MSFRYRWNCRPASAIVHWSTLQKYGISNGKHVQIKLNELLPAPGSRQRPLGCQRDAALAGLPLKAAWKKITRAQKRGLLKESKYKIAAPN